MNHTKERGDEGTTTLPELNYEKCRTCPMYDLLLDQRNIYKAMIEEQKKMKDEQLTEMQLISLN